MKQPTNQTTNGVICVPLNISFLTERSSSDFDSTQLDGKVWVGSFFFATCPSICVEQNTKIRSIIQGLGEKTLRL